MTRFRIGLSLLLVLLCVFTALVVNVTWYSDCLLVPDRRCVVVLSLLLLVLLVRVKSGGSVLKNALLSHYNYFFQGHRKDKQGFSRLFLQLVM